MQPNAVRPPAVAGRFYPASAAELDREVVGFVGDTSRAERRLGVIAPHAGYVYSGAVAGRLYGRTVVPDRVVLLAPNHTGHGGAVAVWSRGAFAVPGATIPVDEELATRLLGRAGVREDHEAHRDEHSLEVHLPFLHARNRGLRVTPLVLGPLPYAACAALGEAIATAIGDDEILVVASSDMNHYLEDAATRRLDERLLERVLALDPRGLHARVLAEDHSMCGFVPATVMLCCAVSRGASRAELVAYGTSGDAFGERDRVVGYAGVAVS